MGLELMAVSIATTVVIIPLPATWNRGNTLCRQRFMVPVILFHHLRNHAAVEVISFQLMLF